MARVQKLTRRYTTPLQGLGPGQLDVLDSLRQGIDTAPELAEDTGRGLSSLYETLLRLRVRRLVVCISPRRGRPGLRGTIPSRWRLTPAGLQALKLARAAGKL